MRKIAVLLVLVLCISLVPMNTRAQTDTTSPAPMDTRDDDHDGPDLGWLGLLGLAGLLGLKRRDREEHARDRVSPAPSRT